MCVSFRIQSIAHEGAVKKGSLARPEMSRGTVVVGGAASILAAAFTGFGILAADSHVLWDWLINFMATLISVVGAVGRSPSMPHGALRATV